MNGSKAMTWLVFKARLCYSITQSVSPNNSHSKAQWINETLRMLVVITRFCLLLICNTFNTRQMLLQLEKNDKSYVFHLNNYGSYVNNQAKWIYFLLLVNGNDLLIGHFNKCLKQFEINIRVKSSHWGKWLCPKYKQHWLLCWALCITNTWFISRAI